MLTDKMEKAQFWARASLLQRARNLCPNHGDFSDLVRDGLEIAVNELEKKLLETAQREQALAQLQEKAS